MQSKEKKSLRHKIVNNDAEIPTWQDTLTVE